MARRILILMCLLPCFQLSRDTYCRRGQFYKRDSLGRVSCVPCREGTYMDQDEHTEVECIRCSEPDSVIYQVRLEECTPDSNTVIGCAPNYFKDDNKQCKLCKDCKHDQHKPIEVRACASDHDTVCCGRGMRAEQNPTDGLYDCVEDTPGPPHPAPSSPGQPVPSSPISETCNGSARACGRGQYLAANCNSHNHSGSCQPCGDGTFMDLPLHNQTSCTACTLPLEAGLQVQSVCNRTHDVVYRRECLAIDTSSYDILVYSLFAALLLSMCIIVALFRITFSLKRKLAQRPLDQHKLGGYRVIEHTALDELDLSCLAE